MGKCNKGWNDKMIRIDNIINENINLTMPAQDIGEDCELTDYGMSSIDFVKLIIAIECEYDIDVDDEHLLVEKLGTKKKIKEYIESKKI